MRKTFILFVICFAVLAIQAQSDKYVDLGLPCGTLWKATNESGLYDYNTAVRKFGNKLPTKEQWLELKIFCTWEWTRNGYKVTGEKWKLHCTVCTRRTRLSWDFK